jgi:phytoene desaturase
MKAIVIGAGFGGIASALRLRAKGYEVKLIDRSSMLGGRSQVYEYEGYRHDAGPTVITAPFLFEELFELYNERLDDYVKLVPLNPWYRFEFADGDHFNYGGTIDETLAEIRRIEPSDCEGYVALLEHSRKIFEVGFTKLSSRPFDRFTTMLRQVPSLITLRSYETVWDMVKRYLKNDKLRQAFSIQPLLVGGNPLNTTSIYGLIHFLERAYGVHFVMGGTGALVNALGDLMQRNGVEIKLNTTIDALVVEQSRAIGVRLDNGTVESADIIISNIDPAHLYTKLVPSSKQALSTKYKLAMANYSMGLFVLYFGTNRTYPDVAHHTICLGSRYEELLKDIFDRKILAQDFSLYLHRPTATDKSFAPEGCDSFYVLCPVPNLQAKIDWHVEGPKLQDRIISALSDSILPGLKASIKSYFFKTPKDFALNYLSVHGAGFSITPLFRQSAWFRFHNKAEGIENLYLTGAGTHPGAGLPGVVCSAKVVDALIPDLTKQSILSQANRILAAKGRSFYWARAFLSNRHASRATRLYGFCRILDDIADESDEKNDPLKALNLIDQALLNNRSLDPAIEDSINLFNECSVDTLIPRKLIEGLIHDMGKVRIKTQDELVRYAYHVAGTVGLMMSGVLDVSDPRANPHAIDLGIAMQLTNICRDVVEDARLGRIYLPTSFNITTEINQLISPTVNERIQVQEALMRILALADDYYKSGEAGISYLPLRARLGILTAARIYRAIGVQIRLQKYNIWSGKIYVPQLSKLWITIKLLITLPFNRTFWRPITHQASLHNALRGLPKINTLI